MFLRSMRFPSEAVSSAVASLLPMKSSSVMNCISSAFMRMWPLHHCSNSRKRGPSVSTLE